MHIFVPRESKAGEKRVAIVPDVITKYIRAGFTVSVESGAGVDALAEDQAMMAAGAEIGSASEISEADVVLSVNPLTDPQKRAPPHSHSNWSPVSRGRNRWMPLPRKRSALDIEQRLLPLSYHRASSHYL
jgi:NAD/NADP transhydrogenase alpha subunit